MKHLISKILKMINPFKASCVNQIEYTADEVKYIDQYLSQFERNTNFYVDIGASDPRLGSMTYFLFKKGYSGLAVDCDMEKYANIEKIYQSYPLVTPVFKKVTPDNIQALFHDKGVPIEFDFLNIDIDGYDYFVLNKILTSYRPMLICAEINEKIPPPILFTVLYQPDYQWNVDHFYGQSISQLYLLCKKYEYDLVKLYYNNAFLIPRELNKFKALTPEEAYDEGYRNQPDRREKFPWNSDMDPLLSLSPKEGIIFIRSKFSRYERKYHCSV